VPPAGEYVADGAAKQAAWALLGQMPTWDLGKVSHHESKATPHVMDKYRTLRDNTAHW
jgi:xylulokinase